MKYLSLSIPGFDQIDSNLPKGVPTGGLNIDATGTVVSGTGANIIQAFIVLTITVAIVTTLWFLLKAGWDMITSRGSKEKFQKGQERIFYALFGLFMVFVSFLLIGAAGALFGTNLLPFIFKNP